MDGTTFATTRSSVSTEPGNPWLVTTTASPSLPVLLVIPHAGAGAAAYRQLAAHLRDVARPFIVRLPGRETRLNEPAYTDIRPLARALALAVQPHLPGQFILYGHSMGALIAFETARVLELAYRVRPAHLVVSGMEPPGTLSRRQRQRHLLPDNQLWTTVRDIGGIPPEMAGNPAARELLLPAIRADFQLVDAYTYRPALPLTCPVTSYAGWSDREMPAHLTTGWAEETSASFTSHILPGNHFFNLDTASGFAQALCRLLIEAKSDARAELGDVGSSARG